MAMQNKVVDFPFSPASEIPNAVVIKKVQSESYDGDGDGDDSGDGDKWYIIAKI